MWPVFINAGWGLVCHFALPATPEAHARKEAAEKAALTGTTLNTVPEEPAKRGITIKEALQIPSVAGYCVAFGFMKTINYVLFFWLCDIGVPRCCGGFTSSIRLVSIRRCRGWFLFRL